MAFSEIQHFHESVLFGEKVIIIIIKQRRVENVLLIHSLSSLPSAEPLSLMDLCRRSVRVALGRERLSEIHRLPLPASLKNYLLYQWRRRHSRHAFCTSSPLILLWDCSWTRLTTLLERWGPTRIASNLLRQWLDFPRFFFLILFLWLFAIVMSNSVKSGNHWALCTCWYRRCRDSDPPTVTPLLPPTLKGSRMMWVSSSSVPSMLNRFVFFFKSQ